MPLAKKEFCGNLLDQDYSGLQRDDVLILLKLTFCHSLPKHRHPLKS